jgi:hypothetical protein
LGLFFLAVVVAVAMAMAMVIRVTWKEARDNRSGYYDGGQRGVGAG